MKINFILNSVEGKSGGAQVVRKYVTLLNNIKDVDAIIYAPIISYKTKKGLKASFERIRMILANIYHYQIKKEIEKKHINYIKIVPKIRNKFIRNADVVIATAWPTAFDVVKLNKNKGKKYYFIQGYEIWDDEKLGKKTYELPLKKIVISTWIKIQLEKQGINEKMKILYNGVDSNNENMNMIKDSSNSKISCLMLSHNMEKKGVKNGLKAFYMAKKENPNLDLKMFGIEYNKIIPKDVGFYKNPSREVINKLYNESDIFIFPSLEEGWGLTPIEAMQAKCAVVATNTGCMLDIGDNKKNALISKPGDVETMSNNILKLANDEKLRIRIGLNGFETVKKMNNWDTETRLFLEILKNEW